MIRAEAAQKVLTSIGITSGSAASALGVAQATGTFHGDFETEYNVGTGTPEVGVVIIDITHALNSIGAHVFSILIH